MLDVGVTLRLEPSGRGAAAGAETASSVTADARRETFVVRRKAGTERDPILGLQGVDDRDGALSLRGGELLVSLQDAPSLPEGEWWAHELEGCVVRDGETEVGVVERLIELPSCEVLEVTRPSGGVLLVPLVKDAVRSVDVQSREIDVDLRFLGEAQ